MEPDEVLGEALDEAASNGTAWPPWPSWPPGSAGWDADASASTTSPWGGNGSLYGLGDDDDYATRPETYFVPVVFGCIFLAGVLGNGTLICMFVSDRKMRNEPNTFIFR